jgi:hypothetical protein
MVTDESNTLSIVSNDICMFAKAKARREVQPAVLIDHADEDRRGKLMFCFIACLFLVQVRFTFSRSRSLSLCVVPLDTHFFFVLMIPGFLRLLFSYVSREGKNK